MKKIAHGYGILYFSKGVWYLIGAVISYASYSITSVVVLQTSNGVHASSSWGHVYTKMLAHAAGWCMDTNKARTLLRQLRHKVAAFPLPYIFSFTALLPSAHVHESVP